METIPILIVKVDNSSNQFSDLHEIQKHFQDRMIDYHVIVVPFSNDLEPIQFQVFYPKDIQEIDFEELKDYIKTINSKNDEYELPI